METACDGMVIAKIYWRSPVPLYNFWHGGQPGLPHSLNNQSQRDEKDAKCCWIMLKISFIRQWWELERLSCNPEDCLFNAYHVAPNGNFPVGNLICFPGGLLVVTELRHSVWSRILHNKSFLWPAKQLWGQISVPCLRSSRLGLSTISSSLTTAGTSRRPKSVTRKKKPNYNNNNNVHISCAHQRPECSHHTC